MRTWMLLILLVSFTVSVFAQQDMQPQETPNRLFRRTLFPRQQDDPQKDTLNISDRYDKDIYSEKFRHYERIVDMKALQTKHGKAVLKKRHPVDNPAEKMYFGIYVHQFVLFYFPENGDNRILFATSHHFPESLKIEADDLTYDEQKGELCLSVKHVGNGDKRYISVYKWTDAGELSFYKKYPYWPGLKINTDTFAEFDRLYNQWMEELKTISQIPTVNTLVQPAPGLPPLPFDEASHTLSYLTLMERPVDFMPCVLGRIEARKGHDTFKDFLFCLDLLSNMLKIKFNERSMSVWGGASKTTWDSFPYKFWGIPESETLLLPPDKIQYATAFAKWLRRLRLYYSSDSCSHFRWLYEIYNEARQKMVDPGYISPYRGITKHQAKETAKQDALKTFQEIKDMGIIILPNLLEKMEEGDETLLPIFTSLADNDRLKTVADCRTWWDANKQRYDVIVNDTDK